jgi:hypothetical protein
MGCEESKLIRNNLKNESERQQVLHVASCNPAN